MPNKEHVEKYVQESKEVLDRIDTGKINHTIETLFDAWKNNKQVFIMGNGGSASNATHLAADLAKTIIIGENKGLRAIPLSDNIPLISAWVNDQGWSELYTGQLKTFFQPGDVAIAFSVHGGSGSEKAGAWSQNILKAIEYVKNNGGTTIGFSGFDGGPLAKISDICIVVPADSTPHVEGLHCVLLHCIVFGLMTRIAQHVNAKEKGINIRQ